MTVGGCTAKGGQVGPGAVAAPPGAAQAAAEAGASGAPRGAGTARAAGRPLAWTGTGVNAWLPLAAMATAGILLCVELWLSTCGATSLGALGRGASCSGLALRLCDGGLVSGRPCGSACGYGVRGGGMGGSCTSAAGAPAGGGGTLSLRSGKTRPNVGWPCARPRCALVVVRRRRPLLRWERHSWEGAEARERGALPVVRLR